MRPSEPDADWSEEKRRNFAKLIWQNRTRNTGKYTKIFDLNNDGKPEIIAAVSGSSGLNSFNMNSSKLQ
jgi:hypothetical protein